MDVEKYKAAIETHKFYDTISFSIVVGQLTITGATFYIYENIRGITVGYFLFPFTALCVLILLFIYKYCAKYANVARNVAAALEEEKITYGVSVAFRDNLLPADKCWGRGIYGLVHLLSIILCLGLVVSAVILAFNK